MMEGKSREKEPKTKMEPMKFCQSCRMPLSDYIRGTERDGSKSADYCISCYENGEFTQDCTIEEMILQRAPLFADSNPDMSFEEAVALLRELMPQLKRWKRVRQ